MADDFRSPRPGSAGHEAPQQRGTRGCVHGAGEAGSVVSSALAGEGKGRDPGTPRAAEPQRPGIWLLCCACEAVGDKLAVA